MNNTTHGSTSRGPATASGVRSIAGEQTSRASGTKYAVMPGKAELKKFRDLGYTRHQIVDIVFERTGHRVTPEAVSMAMKRANLSGVHRRYEDEIPWRVRQIHERHYALAMLRLLGRRRRGESVPDDRAQRLDSWLAKLDETQTVVDYDPDSERGFRYVPRLPTDESVIRVPKD